MGNEKQGVTDLFPMPNTTASPASVRPEQVWVVDDRFLAAVLAGAFYLAVFFPYVQIVPLQTDTQPHALLLAILVLLTVSSRAMPKEILLLFVVFIFSIVLLLVGGGSFIAVRSTANYASLFFVSLASYLILKVRGGFSTGVLKYVVLCWFLVGAVQTFFHRDFLVQFIGRGVGVGGVGGRGVVGLSPEPSHYAILCVFLLLLAVLHRRFLSWRDQVWITVLLVVQVIFFAKSAIGVLCLGSLLAYFLIANLASIRRSFAAFAALGLITGVVLGSIRLGLISFDGTRMQRLAELFLENPSALLMTDRSISDRFFQIYFAFQGWWENFLLPRGYGAWLDYLTVQYGQFPYWNQGRILSGYGAAFFELGFVAILIPWAITLGFYAFYGQDRTSFVVVTLFVHTILLTAIPLALPLLGFIVGYVAFYARHRADEGNSVPVFGPRGGPAASAATR